MCESYGIVIRKMLLDCIKPTKKIKKGDYHPLYFTEHIHCFVW